MITFKPFRAVIPKLEYAKDVAALPYDVFNRKEAKLEVRNKPYSFLRIDRAESNFDYEINLYSDDVYKQASFLLNEWINKNILIQDECESYYLYELITQDHSQTGIVGLTAVNDLVNGSIKDHEKTRTDKLNDRIQHIDTCNAHTGPILMFYNDSNHFDIVIDTIKNKMKPFIDFVSDDAIQHKIYRINNQSDQIIIKNHFESLDYLYIADGHHRAAAAKQIAKQRNDDITNTELSSNIFLSVVFPNHQMKILDYNRVVKDLNGQSSSEILKQVKMNFTLLIESDKPVKPRVKGQFSMGLNNKWYLLEYKDQDKLSTSIKRLDVSILQDTVLNPILGINDPVSDTRIDFVGGVRGLEELEKRLSEDCKIVFALVPTSIDELIEISNLGELMPPKSTWFEPKLRSGLFIHLID